MRKLNQECSKGNTVTSHPVTKLKMILQLHRTIKRGIGSTAAKKALLIDKDGMGMLESKDASVEIDREKDACCWWRKMT